MGENNSQLKNDFHLTKKCLVNFEKLFTLFKSVNYFSQTANAVDPLLNDTVDLHAQAVNYRRNLISA
jgi:hypothetical protein